MEPTYAETRVVKRLSASQPGAIKLARRFGEALVCVRYRRDMQGLIRYTTVELVVDQVAVVPQRRLDSVVAVRIDFDDSRLRRLLLTSGAQWQTGTRTWRMTLRIARRLGLEEKIV